MARTDAQRWLDWRTNGGRLLRRPVRCPDCSRKFAPLIPRQRNCEPCAYQHALDEGAPLTMDELQREKLVRALRQLEIEEAQAKITPERSAALRLERLLERHREQARDRQRRDRAQRGRLPQGPDAKSRPGSIPAHAPSTNWGHVARRKQREGWTPRKIAKFIGRSVNEVEVELARTPIHEIRFQLASSGRHVPAVEETPASSPRGATRWCFARSESDCKRCDCGVFSGERIVHVEEGLLHAACAEALGYDVVDKPRDLRARRKAARGA